MRLHDRRGVTLMEVLIAVSLLALLSVGMLIALSVSLKSLARSNDKLMENRRVVNTSRILEQELQGLVPVKAPCAAEPGGPRTKEMFFQGEESAMRLVSTFSLNQAWRGKAQILEFAVIPGAENRGVRLIVNEIPYSPEASGRACIGRRPDQATGALTLRFPRVEPGPASFVLADKLESCRFEYLERREKPLSDRWVRQWILPRWPWAIRIEMAPLVRDSSRLEPATVTVPLHINSRPEIEYVNQ